MIVRRCSEDVGEYEDKRNRGNEMGRKEQYLESGNCSRQAFCRSRQVDLSYRRFQTSCFALLLYVWGSFPSSFYLIRFQTNKFTKSITSHISQTLSHSMINCKKYKGNSSHHLRTLVYCFHAIFSANKSKND